MVVSQQKRIQTFEAVIWFFQNRAQELSQNPKIAEILEKVKNSLVSINNVNQLNSYAKERDLKQHSSVTLERLDLIKCTNIVAQKLAAHATYIRNKQLLNETNYNERQLANFVDSSLLQIALLITKRAEENLDILRQYRLTDDLMSDLRKAIDEFSRVTAIPPISEQFSDLVSNSRSSLRFIRECDVFLLELDSVMQGISLTNIPLYQEYVVFRFGSIHTSEDLHFRIGVFDADSGARISGAKVTISRTINSHPIMYIRETKPIRNLLFKGIQRGTWTISVEDPRYQSAQCDVEMDNPLKSVVIFALKKA